MIGDERVGRKKKKKIDKRKKIKKKKIKRIMWKMRLREGNEVGEGNEIRWGWKKWRERNGGNVGRKKKRIDEKGEKRKGEKWKKRKKKEGKEMKEIRSWGNGIILGIEDEEGDLDERMLRNLKIDNKERKVGIKLEKMVEIEIKVVFLGGKRGLNEKSKRKKERKSGWEG